MYKNSDELLKLMDPVSHLLFKINEVVDNHVQRTLQKGKKSRFSSSNLWFRFMMWCNWFDRWSLQDYFPEPGDFDDDIDEFDEYQRRLQRKYR